MVTVITPFMYISKKFLSVPRALLLSHGDQNRKANFFQMILKSQCINSAYG